MRSGDATSGDDFKVLYDNMLRRVHDTACSIEKRLQSLAMQFGVTETSRRLHVLIIEDNPDTADSLAMLMRLWGFEPSIACDGVSGLEMATRDKPDVVLTDIGLPGMDGFELAQRIFATAELKDVLLAGVSAYTDEFHRERAKMTGFKEYFGKPPDLVKLHRLLDDRWDAILRELEH